MNNSLEILKKYWGFDAFRSPQDEIIESIGQGQDTLVILPTGGGKSICYQVPALMKEGITIVVSPLIALMKDQVERLQKVGVKALAVFSGLTRDEIDVALDNAVYGDIKLLYVSPERLQTDIFRTRVQKMNVNHIAIDEAHCISQWGYDFRPSYLNIAELRELLPEVPIIALTASATKNVQKDIVEKLQLRAPAIFTKPFSRPNLSYVTRKVENKSAKLLEILGKLGGAGILYVRSRKKCAQLSEFLNDHNFNSAYYHAGLEPTERAMRQEQWMKGEKAIMVCTNAFGMGIDKSNVRFVIHWDIPDALEAYYQEAGRAGRDGKMSYAILLYNQANISSLKAEVTQKFPKIETIKLIYNAICNHLKVPLNNGFMMSFDFDLLKFAKLFKQNLRLTYNVLNILEQEGYWIMSQSIHLPSRAKFLIGSQEIYRFQVGNERYDKLIQLILRTYGGIIDHYTIINERYLSDRLKVNETVLKKQLGQLKQKGVVNYIPYKQNPSLTFLKNRVTDRSLVLDRDFWIQRKGVYEAQALAMIDYCTSDTCKQILINQYFGDPSAEPCGKCSACIYNKSGRLSNKEERNIETAILHKLENATAISFEELKNDLGFNEKKKYLQVIRRMIDDEKLVMDKDRNLSLHR